MSNQTNTPGWCNGSTSDSGSFGLGSSPSPGAKWRYGQAAKTSPSQGEIKGSIPFSATTLGHVLWNEAQNVLEELHRKMQFFFACLYGKSKELLKDELIKYQLEFQ